MQRWQLTEIDAPDGRRDPVVLASEDGARAVLIKLDPGEELGQHQVKERAWLTVVDGSVRIDAGGNACDCGVGTLITFEPGERHSIRADGGARVLLLLAPWPAASHYQPDER